MTVVQTSRKTLAVSRFFTTTCTGCFGHGKRSDSWNERCIACRASSVVSHSP